MSKDIPTTQDKTLEEQAADLGELIVERGREESVLGRHTQRMDELKQMIRLQEKLVFRMLNGNEEEFLPPLPKKPHLRIVK